MAYCRIERGGDSVYCRNPYCRIGTGLLPESYCRIGTGLLPDCPLSPFVTGRRMYSVGLDIGRRPCYNDFAELFREGGTMRDFVVILNDGETWTSLSGVKVLFIDNDVSDDEINEHVKKMYDEPSAIPIEDIINLPEPEDSL